LKRSAVDRPTDSPLACCKSSRTTFGQPYLPSTLTFYLASSLSSLVRLALHHFLLCWRHFLRSSSTFSSRPPTSCSWSRHGRNSGILSPKQIRRFKGPLLKFGALCFDDSNSLVVRRLRGHLLSTWKMSVIRPPGLWCLLARSVDFSNFCIVSDYPGRSLSRKPYTLLQPPSSSLSSTCTWRLKRLNRPSFFCGAS
jgi:hypothetical protein